MPNPSEKLARLTKDDIMRAFREIDRRGVPDRRRSTRYCALYSKRHYPPKLVLAYAEKINDGTSDLAEVPAIRGLFGGPQSNTALKKLGFDIEQCSCGGVRDAEKVRKGEDYIWRFPLAARPFLEKRGGKSKVSVRASSVVQDHLHDRILN